MLACCQKKPERFRLRRCFLPTHKGEGYLVDPIIGMIILFPQLDFFSAFPNQVSDFHIVPIELAYQTMQVWQVLLILFLLEVGEVKFAPWLRQLFNWREFLKEEIVSMAFVNAWRLSFCSEIDAFLESKNNPGELP